MTFLPGILPYTLGCAFLAGLTLVPADSARWVVLGALGVAVASSLLRRRACE